MKKLINITATEVKENYNRGVRLGAKLFEKHNLLENTIKDLANSHPGTHAILIRETKRLKNRNKRQRKALRAR